jgi:hypothetical protein
MKNAGARLRHEAGAIESHDAMIAPEQAGGQVYICPMHPQIRRTGPARCPKCDMALMPEGTRFALLRHMIASPAHLAAMGVVMASLTVTALLLAR